MKAVCTNCGIVITKKNAYKYCSHRCQIDAQHYAWVIRWLQGFETGTRGHTGISNHIRRFLIEKYGNKCSVCDWGEINLYTGSIPVEIDHIDGNPYNNRPHNLRLLCPNCHSLTSTYKGANKGNGRIGRN